MAIYSQEPRLIALIQAIRDEYVRATTTYPFDQCWTRIALHLVHRGVIDGAFIPDFDVSAALEQIEGPQAKPNAAP